MVPGGVLVGWAIFNGRGTKIRRSGEERSGAEAGALRVVWSAEPGESTKIRVSGEEREECERSGSGTPRVREVWRAEPCASTNPIRAVLPRAPVRNGI